MPIRLRCHGCGRKLEVDDAFAGSLCRCGHCGVLSEVPAQPGADESQRPSQPADVREKPEPGSAGSLPAAATEDSGWERSATGRRVARGISREDPTPVQPDPSASSHGPQTENEQLRREKEKTRKFVLLVSGISLAGVFLLTAVVFYALRLEQKESSPSPETPSPLAVQSPTFSPEPVATPTPRPTPSATAGKTRPQPTLAAIATATAPPPATPRPTAAPLPTPTAKATVPSPTRTPAPPPTAAVGSKPGTIVEFEPGKVVLEGPSNNYVSIQRTKNVDQGTEQTWNLDTTQPLFSQGLPIYGGIRVVSLADTLVSPSTMGRLHTNRIEGWPNKPLVFVQCNDSSGGVNAYNLTVLFLWKKADFIGRKGDSKVAFDAGSTLQVHIQNWYSANRDKTRPIDLRFVVKNGGQYYLSEASATAANSTLELTDFSNQAAAGKRWAEFAPAPAAFDLPDSPRYLAVKFDDVEEVGFIGQGSGINLRMFAFDQFSAVAATGPAAGLTPAASPSPAAKSSAGPSAQKTRTATPTAPARAIKTPAPTRTPAR